MSLELQTTPPLSVDGLKRFARDLRDAHLIEELSETLFVHLTENMQQDPDPVIARLDLLEAYYGGRDEVDSAIRRGRADRYFIHKATDQRFAGEILTGINELIPEVPDIRIERLHGTEGMIVLRADDEISAIDDEGDTTTEVSVASIVAATNKLLNRFEVRERFLQMRSDKGRELFFATHVSEGIALCNAGYLEDGSVEELMDFGAW